MWYNGGLKPHYSHREYMDRCMPWAPSKPIWHKKHILGATRKAHYIVSDVVNKVWRLVLPIWVSRLEKNTFMFHSHHEANMDNAYCRRPWSIREGHLVLKPWNPSLTWQEISFTSSTFWVQVQGLPKLWRSSNNLRLLGEKARNVIEVDLAGEGGGS